jgi:ferredoxin/flavodoxin
MRFKIFYITGTRNTERAAKLIQLQLNSMNHECTIVNWIHNDFTNTNKIDAIGFASPVHSLREPLPLRNRLKQISKFTTEEKIPIFIIACCEANTGAFFYRVAKILKKKKFSIIATYTYYAPSNFLMYSKLFERNPKEQDPIRDRGVLEFAKSLPVFVKKKEPIKVKRKIFSGIFASLFAKDWSLRIVLGRKIIVDETKCTKCGNCVKICIAQCIKLDPFPIVNMKKCVVCVGCISLCPNDALDTKITRGRKRFKGLGKLNVQPI